MRKCLLALCLLLASQPLLAEQVWFDATIEGREGKLSVQAFDREDNNLIAPPMVWEQLGIVLSEDEKAKETLSSQELGLSFEVNEAMQSVVFRVPHTRLPVETVNGQHIERVPISPSAKGVLVEYDLAMSTNGRDFNASAGHSISASIGKAVVLTTGQLNATNDGVEYRRGFTSATWDNPETLRSVQVGDIQTNPQNSPSSPVLMGGIRIAKDPTLDTTRPLFALPVLGGVATDASTVQAIINGSKRTPYDVQAGGFEIVNPGMATGLNTTQLVVKDKFGRETIIDQTRYFSTDTLRKGLSQWEVNMGLVRQGVTDTYTTPAIQASYSRGLSDTWTIDTSVEATKEAHNASVGVRAYGRWGAIKATVGQSQSDKGAGKAYAVNYNYNTPRWSVGANVIQQDDTFWDLSQTTGSNEAIRTASVYASRRFGDNLSASASIGKYSQGDYEDTRAELYLNYTKGNNSVSAGIVKSSNDTAVALAYTHRFGRTTTAGIDFRKNRRGQSVGVTVNGMGESKRGPVYWGGRVGTMQSGGYYGNARARIETPTYSAEGRVDIYDNEPTLSLNYRSALWIGEGAKQQVKTQGLSIAVVKVPGVEGVPVYLENRLVGKTNKQGVLVVGPIRELEPNHIRIDVKALPYDFDISEPAITVSPNRNHVALVEYKPSAINARTFRLTHDGQDVPLGKILSDGTTMVGYFGEVYLDNPQPGQTLEIEGLCKATLPEDLPEFGDTPTVECK